MHSARRRLTFLSAAIAALAAVLAVVLPLSSASAAAVSAAGTRVGASHPQTILPVGLSRPVSAGEGRCGPAPQPLVAAGAVFAAEDAGGSGTNGGGNGTVAGPAEPGDEEDSGGGARFVTGPDGVTTDTAVDPAGAASSWQGQGHYPGVDSWVNTTLPPGSRIAFGEPGPSGFAAPADLANGPVESYWQGLQVEPNPIFGYRTTVSIWEATDDLDVAASYALRNPQFGDGGTPQFFVPGIQAPGDPYMMPPQLRFIEERGL